MNIREQLSFNPEKPTVFPILKTEKIRVLAVGVIENQKLSKHNTPVPTLLTMITGKIEFTINGETKVFNSLDTYEIPVKIDHEVRGLEAENIFTLTQQLT
jgi:quercetin dioxygenase-like cupin family protein